MRDQQFVNNDDIYFYVTLTSSRDDGPKQFLIGSLISNFKKMFPPSRSTGSYVYSINNNNGNPVLFGLIFLLGLEYLLNPTILRIILNRPIMVRVLQTENIMYKNKQYLTKTDIIREKYNSIIVNGNAVGYPFESFTNHI